MSTYVKPDSTRLRPVLALFLSAVVLSGTAAFADDIFIEGKWLTAKKDGWIEIRLTEDGPIGIIAGSPDDPNNEKPPRRDSENPDPALRDRSLLGVTIMQGFVPDGSGKWKGGKIYDPDNGKTYNCKLTLADANTVKLRGYLGVSLFGRTETWTRVIE